jgi:hypothetical protein
MTLNPRDLIIAIIAILLVATYCAAVLYGIFNGKGYVVPDAFFAVVVSVVSYFFGQHAATNGAYAAGDAAATAAASTLAQTRADAQAKAGVPPGPAS